MGMPLKLFVKASEIRGRFLAFVETPHGRAEEGLFQAAVVPVFGQRPGEVSRLSPFQVFIHRAPADGANTRDLPLAQS